eukprot:3671864-Heterocapsa_arctica.AAC.1
MNVRYWGVTLGDHIDGNLIGVDGGQREATGGNGRQRETRGDHGRPQMGDNGGQLFVCAPFIKPLRDLPGPHKLSPNPLRYCQDPIRPLGLFGFLICCGL